MDLPYPPGHGVYRVVGTESQRGDYRIQEVLDPLSLKLVSLLQFITSTYL